MSNKKLFTTWGAALIHSKNSIEREKILCMAEPFKVDYYEKMRKIFDKKQSEISWQGFL